jgi:hypothetical protein
METDPESINPDPTHKVFYYEEDRIVVKSMAPLSPRITKNENTHTKNACYFEGHVKRVYFPWVRILMYGISIPGAEFCHFHSSRETACYICTVHIFEAPEPVDRVLYCKF